MVKDYGLVNKKYYGDRFHLNLKVFPSGKELSYPYPQPESKCFTKIFFQSKLGFKLLSNSSPFPI